MGSLLGSDGSPLGGNRPFDGENRQRFPEDRSASPEPCAAQNDHFREALDYIEPRFPRNPARTESFHYPVTLAEAFIVRLES